MVIHSCNKLFRFFSDQVIQKCNFSEFLVTFFNLPCGTTYDFRIAGIDDPIILEICSGDITRWEFSAMIPDSYAVIGSFGSLACSIDHGLKGACFLHELQIKAEQHGADRDTKQHP